MLELESPDSIDDLYRDRGSVSVAVPITQGDVFENVPVPGLSEEPMTVQIVMHPCSSRGQGAQLRERVTVIPVTVFDQGISKRTWQRNFRLMLLPDLRNDGQNFAADFRDLAPARSSSLQLDKRIATLSANGILLLQQRLICANTRYVVDRPRLSEALGPIMTELEIQESWTELALAGNSDEDEEAVVRKSVEQFDTWLNANDRALRSLLDEPHNHASLRRQAIAEAKRLYGPGSM
jgi:hypothetical protein